MQPSFAAVVMLLALSALASEPYWRTLHSASDLLHEYWNYEKETVAKYQGQALDVSGLVGKVHAVDGGVALDLQVNERSYFVRCLLDEASVEAARQLDAGQLVVVHGEGAGCENGRPSLTKCSVAFALTKNTKRPMKNPWFQEIVRRCQLQFDQSYVSMKVNGRTERIRISHPAPCITDLPPCLTDPAPQDLDKGTECSAPEVRAIVESSPSLVP